MKPEDITHRCADCLCDYLEADGVKRAGKWLCPSCAEKYYACEECSRFRLEEDMYGYCGMILCEECFDNHHHACIVCGDYYTDYDVDRSACWGGMCPSCSDSHFLCESCNNVFHEDDYGEDNLCRDCYSDHDSTDGLPSYHEGCNGIHFLPDADRALYFGVEIETDRYDDRSEAILALYEASQNKTLFWYEDDSSLNNGIEIISQPATLDYHLDKFPWKVITDIAQQSDARSHNTDTCGMHIHFNRTFFNGNPDLYTLRLIYLFEKFSDEIAVFSRRRNDKNCLKYNRELFDKPAPEKIRDLYNLFHRYQNVNITPPTTIEIRTFRGTLKVSTILASLELVDFLVRYARKTNTKKLQEITWPELVKEIAKEEYQYLLPYMTERGLTTEELWPCARTMPAYAE